MADKRIPASAFTLLTRVACLVLMTVCIWQYVCHVLLQVQIEFAREQVSVFEEMKCQAKDGSQAEAEGALVYTENYYPSGTKQVSGSDLDYVVEVARSSAVVEIRRHIDAAESLVE